MTEDALFIGIDSGTGGVRALAVTGTGRVVSSAEVPTDRARVTHSQSIHEQSPEAWWDSTVEAIRALMEGLESSGLAVDSLAGLAVDGTSETLVCLGAGAHPLRPAIMYNDSRSGAEAAELTEQASSFCERLGYRFEASFALAKILWVSRHEPDLFGRTVRFAHHADYVAGRLTGDFGVSDTSNALKTGYDLIEDRWPPWMEGFPGLMNRLPRIVPSGTQTGQVSAAAARETGLPEGLPVAAGATDGTAAVFASGLSRPGDYNTTLGTTLVFKGISLQPCRHPQGIIYCHRFPDGKWLPGAASNTGGEWIEALFAGEDLPALDCAASPHLPNRHLAYPLVGKGERFPFLSPTAEGFFAPVTESKADRYAARLQGVALIERLGYGVLDETAGTSGGDVYSTGGGSRSDVWMQCRADATGRTMHRAACAESAFGSAILAAAGLLYDDLSDAIRGMVRIERTFLPNAARLDDYSELHGCFCAELERRGYR